MHSFCNNAAKIFSLSASLVLPLLKIFVGVTAMPCDVCHHGARSIFILSLTPFKVSKSKIYEHCKRSLNLLTQDDREEHRT